MRDMPARSRHFAAEGQRIFRYREFAQFSAQTLSLKAVLTLGSHSISPNQRERGVGTGCYTRFGGAAEQWQAGTGGQIRRTVGTRFAARVNG